MEKMKAKPSGCQLTLNSDPEGFSHYYSKTLAILVVLALVFGFATSGFSEDFPKKPIRIIIPFAAGGSNELIARSYQKPMEKDLGTKLLIESIPGGSTKVGTMELAKAKPDGYTLIFMSSQSWVALYYSKTYESRMWEIFTPVGTITAEPYGFVGVSVDSPIKTWADLAKTAKEKPGSLSAGGPAAGGIHEIMKNELLKETKFVPFLGAVPMNTALIGGHIDLIICSLVDAAPMLVAGKIRGLAISSDKRMAALPDVPTFTELGIGESLTFKRSLWAPAKTPSNIVGRILKAVEKAIQDPEFIRFTEKQMLCKVEYRNPEKTKEDTLNYDKRYGPKLAEVNR